MPTVTIRPGEVDEETISATVGYEHKREIGHMRRLIIDVERSAAQAVTLNAKNDLIQLGSLDPVRLVDIQTGGPVWTLVCYSLEWDANREPFTSGGNLREGDDQTLITNLVGEVASWSAGSIGNFSGALSFVFSHAHQHEALRRIERNVTGEIQFRDEGTVDYLDRLGSDKTGSVELSASAGTIEQNINITERGRQLDGTHIRVLGAHEGEAQLFANLVPSGDSGNYDNEVTYTTSRWSSPADTDWDRWENKDIADQATLDEEAAALGEEITESLVEAKTRTSNTSLEVGDTVQVVKPEADLDRAMRVHRITTKAGARSDTDSAAAEVDHLLLSTRTTARDDASEDLRSIRQFNTGFQGTSVVIQGGGSRQPVDSGINAEIPFNYPQIEFENEAELQVRGLPYRAYSSGAASGGGSVETSAFNTEYAEQAFTTGSSAGITGDGTYKQTDSFSTSELTAWMAVTISVEAGTSSGGSQVVECRVRNTDTGDEYLNAMRFIYGSDGSDGNSATIIVPGNVSGDNFVAEIKTFSGTNYLATTVWRGISSHQHNVTIPNHVHPVDPGISEFASDTPTGVDVIIDGNTVATDIGSGTFETTVDISGQLTQDAWNLIELTSDTLGHIQATISADVYKQIGTQ